ncbi:MAG: type III PLP-dependent enzyme [Chloroflexi bacterium CG07_land_8_20_14_0_80_51_10]|nr:MAG: type III PLP-dependent enzyme [Chloroflexi bacterium CG07_land_8_20_14_0_80_51_10]
MLTDGRSIPQHVVRLAQTRKTPFLAIDKKVIQHKFEQFQNAMTHARIFYAVKTNSHRRIVETLQALGSGFEVASAEELDLLLRCGVPPQRIISSNPIKIASFIEAAYGAGVQYFAFDSHDEIEKLAKLAPGSSVYLRLSVSNEDSQWPLSRKFGVETEQTVELLTHAARRSLVPWGITFHVGSQCIDGASWVNAIEKSKLAWDMARREGIELRMLNIGGGFPIEYTDSVPSIDRIAKAINEALKGAFPEDIEIFVEPGRAFVGEAGILVSTVIAKAKRNGENWLYLDIGVFNGLMESIGGIQYAMTADRDGPAHKWVVAGPSCDSFDVISNEVELPDLEIGEKVYISSAGAYTTVYASRFNGFPIPKTYFV